MGCSMGDMEEEVKDHSPLSSTAQGQGAVHGNQQPRKGLQWQRLAHRRLWELDG